MGRVVTITWSGSLPTGAVSCPHITRHTSHSNLSGAAMLLGMMSLLPKSPRPAMRCRITTSPQVLDPGLAPSPAPPPRTRRRAASRWAARRGASTARVTVRHGSIAELAKFNGVKFAEAACRCPITTVLRPRRQGAARHGKAQRGKHGGEVSFQRHYHGAAWLSSARHGSSRAGSRGATRKLSHVD